MAFILESSAFIHLGEIPRRYTCDGEDISPPLRWSGFPKSTKSFALVVDDPDAPDPAAPARTWVHWVLYNIPGRTAQLPEGVCRPDLDKETTEGLNDWKQTRYGGPCPPVGKHRYFFKVYALDQFLEGIKPATKKSLEKAMTGHILAMAELIGYYKR